MLRRAFLGAVIALAAGTAQAQNGTFCAGFEAGWQAAYENRGLIPAIPPICPIPPIGRDTWQGGFEMGMIAAIQQINRNRY